MSAEQHNEDGTVNFDLGNIVFRGYAAEEMPAGVVPVDAIAVVRYVDMEGGVFYQTMSTRDISIGEQLGMTRILSIGVEGHVRRQYEGD